MATNMTTFQGYPQAQQQQPHHHQPTTLEEVRTLWIGDLQFWVDENYLTSCFSHSGEVSLSLSLDIYPYRISSFLMIFRTYDTTLIITFIVVTSIREMNIKF